jgi:hypothetical protein
MLGTDICSTNMKLCICKAGSWCNGVAQDLPTEVVLTDRTVQTYCMWRVIVGMLSSDFYCLGTRHTKVPSTLASEIIDTTKR